MFLPEAVWYAGLLCLAAAGHVGLWVMWINRVNATGWPRRCVKSIAAIGYAAELGLPWLLLADATESFTSLPAWPPELEIASRGYLALCIVVGIGPVGLWFVQRITHGPSPALLSNHSRIVDLTETQSEFRPSTWKARWLSRLPGNHLYHLQVTRKELRIPRLPPEWDGLTILHLSDLHLAGHLPAEYYRCVVEISCQMHPDMIALTGDVLDYPQFLPWVPEIFSSLTAPNGKYAILGNHDLRVGDLESVRNVLGEAGFKDVGPAPTRAKIREINAFIAGNECPWIKTDLRLQGREAAGDAAFRLLLSHTPDQFPWAVREGFDLVLAGHTHAGQIQFPLIGPTVCPSRFGVRYAAGTFQKGRTVMHVSQGTASMLPLRWGCYPELALLTLRPGDEHANA